MIAALAVVQVCLFQMAAWPAAARIIRRKSSADCSLWREWLVLVGVVLQLIVMWHDGSGILVLASPISSLVSLSVLISVTYWYR